MEGSQKREVQLSFKKSIERLEEIMGSLENDEPDLEKSIELFEEGVKLLQDCINELDLMH